MRVIAVLLGLAALAAGCGREVPTFDRAPFAREPPGPGDMRGRVLVTNNGDGTLSVLPAGGPGAAGRLAVGFNPVDASGPHHTAVDAQGRFVYLLLSFSVATGGAHAGHGTSTAPGYVVKLDARDGRTLASQELEPDPGDCTLSPDGRALYAVHHDIPRWTAAAQAGDLRQGDSNLLVLDADTLMITRRVPLCPAAQGVRTSADGRELYAACGPDEIAVLDLTAPDARPRRVLLPDLAEAGTCQFCPHALAVAPDGTVWVSLLGAVGADHEHGFGGVAVYEPRAGFRRESILELHGSAMMLDFDGTATGYRALVAEQGHYGDRLHVMDLRADGLYDTLDIDFTPEQCLAAHATVVVPAAGRAGVLCEGDHTRPGSLLWLDLARLTPLDRAATGVGSDGVTLVPGP
jgi:DNA-binding beta-propeller fold protein YncE